MMTLSSTLSALQAAAVGILSADPVFSGSASANGQTIPIVTELKGDITSQIQLCLGQVGIAVLILTPLFQFHDPDQNLTPDLNGWATLTATVFEDAVVNQGPTGSGIQAIQLAERIVCVMHYTPHGVITGLVAADPTSAKNFLGVPKPIELMSEGPPLQYNVSFQAHIQLNATIQ